MPAAASAAPPAAPATDVPRHVADLSDIQRCADSKKDDVMDRTSVNTQSWIAFRFQFYMALITRCNIWTQLNTLSPFTDAAPCVSHRYDAGKNSAASTPLTGDQAQCACTGVRAGAGALERTRPVDYTCRARSRFYLRVGAR